MMPPGYWLAVRLVQTYASDLDRTHDVCHRPSPCPKCRMKGDRLVAAILDLETRFGHLFK